MLVVVTVAVIGTVAAVTRVALALDASAGRRSKAWLCISIDALLVEVKGRSAAAADFFFFFFLLF